MAAFLPHKVIVVGVMKMGNIVPIAGIQPTSPAFWVSELTITAPRLPGVTTLLMLTCIRLPSEVSGVVS